MNIIILPGLDGTGLLAPKLRHALEGNHSVTTLAYPPHLCRYEDILEWTKSQLPNDDFILVAESFSGPVAVLLGAEAPPKLKGIAFVATFARRPVNLPVFLAYLIEIMPLRSWLIAKLAQPFLMGKWENRAFTDQFRQVLYKVPASILSKRLADVLKVDVVDALKRIDVPILYLRATKDRLIPAKMAQDFAGVSGRVQDIEGPHFLLQARADLAPAQIGHFADNLE